MPSEFYMVVLFALIFAALAPIVMSVANRVDRHAH